jgi:hypothetical protein
MDRFSTVRPHSSPGHVYEIWAAEFDRAYDEGGLFVLTMRPHVIGHRSRISMLEARRQQHAVPLGSITGTVTRLAG